MSNFRKEDIRDKKLSGQPGKDTLNKTAAGQKPMGSTPYAAGKSDINRNTQPGQVNPAIKANTTGAAFKSGTTNPAHKGSLPGDRNR